MIQNTDHNYLLIIYSLKIYLHNEKLANSFVQL